jgi:hypothetical protein
MRHQLFGIVLGLCVASAAQALAPNEAITGAKTETAASTKSAADAQPSNTAASDSTAPSPTVLVTAEQDKKWRSKGYKPVTHNGTKLYCRREPTLGTHFETNVCRTPADLENAERSAQYYLEQNQRIGNASKCPNCKYN